MQKHLVWYSRWFRAIQSAQWHFYDGFYSWSNLLVAIHRLVVKQNFSLQNLGTLQGKVQEKNQLFFLKMMSGGMVTDSFQSVVFCCFFLSDWNCLVNRTTAWEVVALFFFFYNFRFCLEDMVTDSLQNFPSSSLPFLSLRVRKCLVNRTTVWEVVAYDDIFSTVNVTGF